MDIDILTKLVENSVKLDRALRDLDEIKAKQETNHIVSLALREHKTIERVDSMWVKMGELNMLVRAVAGVVALVVASAPALLLTHTIWRWP